MMNSVKSRLNEATEKYENAKKRGETEEKLKEFKLKMDEIIQEVRYELK